MRQNILIRGPGGIRRAGSLVLGRDLRVEDTAGGLPELVGVRGGEPVLEPSGGDDTQAIQSALAARGRVRLGPGTFTVSSTISLGTGQSVAGCGPDRTTVSLPDDLGTSYVFILSGSGTAVEDLTILGPDRSTFAVGVYTSSATDVRLRGLRFVGLGYGAQLTGVSRVEVSGAALERIYNTGIWISGEQAAITGLYMDSSYSTTGLLLSTVEGLRCEGVTLRRGTRGILAQGNALSFRSVRLVECVASLTIGNSSSGIELSGVQTVDGRGISFSIANSTGIAIDGCSVLRGRRSALSLAGCTAVTVNGFHSDMNNAAPSTDPHVVVSGSTGVTLSGVRRVNPPTPPTYEVDVSGAGGRVVFVQHDFDPARINSGGNFVAL